MAAFLFWNLKRQPIAHLVDALVREHRVDVVVLAECEIPDAQLLTTLNAGERPPFSLPPSLAKRLKIVVRYPADCLRAVSDEGGIAIRRLMPRVGRELLFAAVHLPSRLHTNEREQLGNCEALALAVVQAEERVGHDRTIIFGDLNMNPYESGVVDAKGLHAVLDRRIAERGSRQVRGQHYRIFYNPMWSHFGDSSPGPPGTYYYDDSGHYVNYFWHMFDQVLVSQGALPHFLPQSVRVLTTAGVSSLLSGQGTPAPSDHLPLLFSVNLEKEITNEEAFEASESVGQAVDS